ncbi:hypothetical protein HDU83_006386 [Entophlyctis luteolus]|nr:hypothetical protein HDU82_008897 [Entophlyctis luteolus]KAJ3341901.1 hypothetical protein HDU83_006386 [Entophlyctis luteolus]KAJ3380386.1 hypothetical protein HDU84_005957 [Entophlyctis sp. JEL0112]
MGGRHSILKRSKPIGSEGGSESGNLGNGPPIVEAAGGYAPAEQTVPGGSIDSGIKAVDWSVIDPGNRRAYHNLQTSIYMLPDEEPEQRRLLLQNRVLAMAFGGHTLAPGILENPNRPRIILDVGCANGVWMESLFFGGNLSSKYHGVDITLNPSDFGTVCGAKIAVGDVTQRLPYSDNTFDYVHQRALFLGVPKHKWPHVLNELARVTKPGGWIELVECSGLFKDVGEAAKMFAEKMETAFLARGVDINLSEHEFRMRKADVCAEILAAENLPEYAEACTAITNVGHKVVQIPLGWGGEVGDLYGMDVRNGMILVGDFLTKAFGVDDAEYLTMVEAAAAEWPTTKAYGEWIGLWAQVQ